VGGFLEAACHSLMHEVGRTWAKRHGVTLQTLNRYVPRSNDPGCSAGFGMGMAMYLGPELVVDPKKVLATCSKHRPLPRVHVRPRPRARLHARVPQLPAGCRHGVQQARGSARAGLLAGRVPRLLISLGGGDDRAPETSTPTPVHVRGVHGKRPCWFRYFWEREASKRVYETRDLLDLCDGREGMQRAGCMSGASLLVSRERDPVDHARVCNGLQGSDTYDCLRGVNVPAPRGVSSSQVRPTCGDLPSTTNAWCYRWFGRTLAVLTDGNFRTSGCPQLEDASARGHCERGARRTSLALRTFS
jgi:hypothetical protein